MAVERTLVLDEAHGADPNTDWLGGSGITLDRKGFVLTGSGFDEDRRPFETSRKGIFAIGDVRSGSVKRVAAAVGEGAQVVTMLHSQLRESAFEAKVDNTQPH